MKSRKRLPKKKVHSTVWTRPNILEKKECGLSITKQCKLSGISRSSHYYVPTEIDDSQELEKLKRIMEVHIKYPFYGYRKIAKVLEMHNITRKMVRLIMRKIGLRAIYPGPNLSKPRKDHKKYSYLLRDKNIWFPNQVWATDITYITLNGHNVYLVAIVDLFSRKVLSWRLSNTMDVSFCIEALEEALMLYGIPAIFNTDQGSQFTSDAFISVLESQNIEISMDGKGRALDNIYVERLWRSLKYEEIYLKSYEDMKELKKGIGNYFSFFNTTRFHQSLDYETPDTIYYRAFSEEIRA